ncbi:MAG: hypothetical protein WAT71_01375 [Ignavibacteria bacterium]
MKNIISNESSISASPIFSEINFNSFTYSKKAHFQFFQENNYDYILYGRRIEPEESDIRIYQNLLIYAFVINNIEKGAKILEIGSEYSQVFEKLKTEYECWKFVNPVELGKNIMDPENLSDDNLNKPESTDNINLTKYYFDMIFSISAFENIPETENYFNNISLNIRSLLKPIGYSVNCFINVINKDNIIWSHKLINYFFENEFIVNEYTDKTKIIQDRDLFILSENYYKKYIEKHTNLSFQDYGKMFSYNLVWKNLKYLSSDNFQEFTYSKKSHFELFNSFKISENIFGKEVDSSEYDILKYQELLVYSYIKNNLKNGSKILKIGSLGDNLINVLKNEYEIFKFDNVLEFSSKIYSKDNFDFQFIKNINKNQIEFFPLKYFDFIFTISGFDEIEDNLRVFTNVISNIKTFKSDYALVLLSFNNIFYDGIAQSNSLIYFLLNNVEIINKFYRKIFMLEDKDIFLKSENNFSLEEKQSSVSVDRVCYNILWKTTPLLSTVSYTRPNETLKSKPAYIFHHIMKCGGTSVVNSLYKWFFIQFDYTDDPNGILFKLNDFHKFKYNLYNIYSDTCLVSHFQYDGYLLPQR